MSYYLPCTGEPFLGSDYYYSKGNIHIETQNLDITKMIDEFNNKNVCVPIVFMKTEFLYSYLQQLIALNTKFVLITVNNDDMCVPFFEFPFNNKYIEALCYKLLDSFYLVKWFTKNSCITHNKLVPLPIGPKWNWYNAEFFSEDKNTHLEIFNTYCKTPVDFFKNNELKQNLLYFNFNVHTTGAPFYKYHTGIREQTKDILLRNNFSYNVDKPFKEYIQTLSTYKFSISPPGRGIDTHRAWESIMVGTIPIMIHTPLDSLFNKLPVLIIDDYSCINPQFLENKYNEIKNKDYDFSILYSDYWDNYFKETTNI